LRHFVVCLAWGPVLIALPLAFLTSLAGAGLGALLACRSPNKDTAPSRPERARLVYPCRVVVARSGLLCPLVWGVVPLALGGWLCPVPPAILACLPAQQAPGLSWPICP
jgi:hypothetical protein